MAACFELFAERRVVVDLAVKNEPGVFVAAVHRLMTGSREVNDRKPAEAETAMRVVKDQFAGIVRAAMRHLIAHSRDERRLYSTFARAVLPNSANPTHLVARKNLPA